MVQPDVAEKLESVASFLEEMRGDMPLEVTERQRLHPGDQIADRELADLGDGPIADANVESMRLELGAMALGALLRRLILTQEDADVLLVLLFLEVDEEGNHSLVAAGARVEQLAALRGAQFGPGRIHRDPLAFAEFGERPALVVVPRLGPGVECAVAEGSRARRNDQRLVILEGGAEAGAAGTGAARAVERKELRARGGRSRSGGRTFEPRGEGEDRVLRRGLRVDADDLAVTISFAKRRSGGVGETAAIGVVHGEPIDDDQQLLRRGEADLALRELVEMDDDIVGADANEAALAQHLDDHVVAHALGPLEREGDVEARPRVDLTQDVVSDRLDGVRPQLAAASRAVGAADARPETAGGVVDLRSRG